MFTHALRRRLRRRRALALAAHARRATPSRGTRESTYVRKPPYFDGMPARARAGHRHRRRPRAGQARRLGHHRPHLARPARSRPTPRPAEYLAEHGVAAAGLQLLRLAARQPRGDDPRHLRQHPAAQPAARRASRAASPATTSTGAQDVHLRRRRGATQAAGIPLVVLAGKEYGSGSSRDWAAKGTALLGVKAVIAESFERIHRSQPDRHGRAAAAVPGGPDADSLGLTGNETFSITGVTALNDGDTPRTVLVTRRARGRRGGRVRRRRCASTPPARRTTTATAASCSTCCAASPASDARSGGQSYARRT